MISHIPELLTRREIVNRALNHIPLDPGPCVYFLVADGRILYVGSTQNLIQRLAQHQKDKNFTHVHVLPTDVEILRHIEAEYIYELRPQLNVKISKARVRAWRRARRGLPPVPPGTGFLRALDVAHALDISLRRAQQLMKAQTIPSSKLDGVWLTPLEDFVEWWITDLDGRGLGAWIDRVSPCADQDSANESVESS